MTSRLRRTSVVPWVLVLLASCGSSHEGGVDDVDCRRGTERCACTAEMTCDPGLVCEDEHCVPEGAGGDGSGGEASGGDAGDGEGGALAGTGVGGTLGGRSGAGGA